MDGRKKCGRCGETKSGSEFWRDTKHGRRCYCIACCKAYKHERNAKRVAMAIETKQCKQCEAVLPASEFYSHAYTADSLSQICKECVSIDRRAKKYGLTREEVLVFLSVPECQNPRCRMPFEHGPVGDKQMNFDHCHSMGHLRGVLCTRCNTAAAGRVYECIERLRGLVQYLKDSEAMRREQRSTCGSA